jgi:PIN domain nuclease of toxin-antitoxin system
LRVLLDTHLLLWALASPTRLSSKTRRRIQESEVFASAASIWEISIKSALGKLAASPNEVLSAIEPAGFEHLPVVGAHAAHVAKLPLLHRDPFDRLLVAQASVEGLILLTDDDALGGYGAFVAVV